MTVHPRLVRSIPFWILIAGSVAAIGGGAYILVDKLGNMQTTILDNTATGVDVYVGQIWGVFGGILVGAGIVGLALALAVAALRSLVATPPRGVAEQDAPGAADQATVVPAETTGTSVIDAPAVDASTTSTLESPANDIPTDAPQR
ncbi:dinucleotide-utilizing enzyme [Microbacterium arborescens]|uniref:dinucleotide-utilizing enzyme n=1 Tax=Microbacterium arborescens TaxID=33883 RepID=UPI003C78AEEF